MKRFASALLLLGLCGCGDLAGDRTLELHQLASTGDPSSAFIVDTSQLPRGAIESQTEYAGRAGPVSKLELRCGYPVRVVLVPATQP